MTQLLKGFRKRFLKSPFFGKVAILAGGTALGQVLAILASPILTRLYTPEDFGYLALYASLLAVIVVVGSLKYQLAIPLPESDEDAFSLVIISLISLVLVTVLTSLMLWVYGQEMLVFLRADILLPYLGLLPLGLLGAGIYQILNYWAIRKGTYQQLAITKIAQGIGLVVTQILLGIMKAGPLGLILGDVVGRVMGSFSLIRHSPVIALWDSLSWQRLVKNAKRYRRFPLLSSGSALFNSAGLQLPNLMLLALYGLQAAGWFALSQRMIGIPINLLGGSVGQVFIGKAAQLSRESPKELRILFLRTTRRLFFIALLPCVLLFLIGPEFFSRVFGSTWSQAGQYARILAPMFLLQLCVVPLSQTLNIFERQDLQLIWDLGRFGMVFAALWISHIMQWSDESAMLSYGLVMVVSYLVLFIMCFKTLDVQASKVSL